jgi:flagellar hook-associated protein 1 FlgK
MSSLFGSLSIALRSLLAQQAALETTGNIAHVGMPGDARHGPALREEAPVFSGAALVGEAVRLKKVESIRDQILELRRHQETQQQGRLEAFLGAARQVDTLFNETRGIGLDAALSKFFDSFETLSADPTSLPLRQAVLTAGQNLAEAFRGAATHLTQLQRRLDQTVGELVGEINALTAEIARLSRPAAAGEAAAHDPSARIHKRTEAIRKLASLVDISVIDADQSLSITTAEGTVLVVNTQSYALETHRDPSTGFQNVFAEGTDITTTLTAGKLGGTLAARDEAIRSFLADLDSLAAELRNTVNSAHRAGYDLCGALGRDFFLPFVPATGSNAGAANSFAMALTDPNQVAASSDGAFGGTGNLASLAGIRHRAIINGQGPVDFYAHLVFRIRNDVAGAEIELEAEDLVLQQLENQRGTISGASLEEEAANLVRYQRAFEAAARVVASVDELMRAEELLRV